MGTQALAKTTRKNEIPLFVAKAGFGFQKVYEDVIKEGKDPLMQGSSFLKLYEDNKHPSLAGSYLASCIISASFTGKRISKIDGKPKALDAEFAKYLRSVADRVVFNGK